MQPSSHFLQALPETDLSRLLPHLEPVALSPGQVLRRANQPVEHVYFPGSSVVSLVLPGDAGLGLDIEIGVVGREGIVGADAVLGRSSVLGVSRVQVAGKAHALPIEVLRQEFARSEALRTLMLGYLRFLLRQTAQIALCNRVHPVIERLARWLLMLHDRNIGNVIEIERELVTQMLGAHQPGVTVAAGALRRAGLIDYTRGSITILDRESLERASCSCYASISQQAEKNSFQVVTA